jgi:NTP pyrophosphatase (non-canonical NTP hydrolase)
MMDLNILAEEAWDSAETKGHHVTLNGVSTLGAREQALLALAPLAVTVNTVIQTIKRRGVSLAVWDDGLAELEGTLRRTIDDTFDALLLLCGTNAPPKKVDPDDQTDATAIRLLLMFTEIAEALELLRPERRMTDAARQDALGEELSDIFIRGGDLAHGLGIDLDATVERKLLANQQRPYGYGTPLEKKTHP